MADTIRTVDYYYVTVPDKPGEGLRVLEALRQAGVNLLAYSGFPSGKRSQLDFVPADGAAFKAAVKGLKLKVVGPKKVFLLDGEDRVGAVAGIMRQLAVAKINVTALDAACAGGGRWAAILWVKPGDVKKAQAALGAA